jgi:hypothetical protein
MSVRNDNNVGVACSPAQVDNNALKKVFLFCPELPVQHL